MFAFLLVLGLFFQDKNDIVQTKDRIYIGKIRAIDEEAKTIELDLEKGGMVKLNFSVIVPYSLYKILLERIQKNDPRAHIRLAEYCFQNGLYSLAIKEWDEAVALDPSLRDDLTKKKEEAKNEEARTKFEQARKFAAEKKYEDAAKLLGEITQRYPNTPYFEEAKKEMVKLTEEIRRAREEADKARDEAKKAAAEWKEKSQEKGLLDQAVQAFEEAQKAWSEGLDWEARLNITKADRAWKSAEQALQTVKRNAEALTSSKDTDLLKKIHDLDREADVWLVRIYDALARLWSVELNYPEALKWINLALKIRPDDAFALELKLTLSTIQMKLRSQANHPVEK